MLGLALAVAPIGGWIAITGYFNWAIILLGLAVGIWIAAFDVIYACQDINFDKAQGLNSMPVRFGVTGAMKLSKIMHIKRPFENGRSNEMYPLYWTPSKEGTFCVIRLNLS